MLEVIYKEFALFKEDIWLNLSMVSSIFIVCSQWKSLKGKDQLIGAILLFHAFIQVLSTHMAIYNVYSAWIYNIVYALFSLLIWKTFKVDYQQVWPHRLISGVYVSLVMLHLLNCLFFQGFVYLATITIVLFQIFNMVVAYLYLQNRLEQFDEPIMSQIRNWFALAVIIDNVVSIPTVALLSEQMVGLVGYDRFGILHTIHGIIYGLWFLITAAGILWNTTSLSSRFSSSSS